MTMSNHVDDIVQSPTTNKGKGKVHDNNSSNSEFSSENVYPPTGIELEETRRVEENLRRWEVTERQRRKAAREAPSHSGPSFVQGVSERASLLLTGKKRRNHPSSSFSMGNPEALRSQDSIDVVPLTHVPSRSTPSPTHSELDRNPFTNPREPLSPFDDVHAARDSLLPSSQLSDTLEEGAVIPNGSLSMWQPIPVVAQPHTRSPPKASSEVISTEKESDVRWWHEWLCGCGEGHDRGGDHQAGHTNPLE